MTEQNATTTTTTETTPVLLERETCSRCGGSGRYSYCQMYGSTCFKCAGKGVTLTKRGAAAMNYLIGLRSKPASELKIGDRIKTTGVTMGGAVYSQWATIENIRPGCVETDGGCVVNGVTIPFDLVIETNRNGGCQCGPNTVFQVGQTKEQIASTLTAALVYQDTLTKAGTPRKR